MSKYVKPQSPLYNESQDTYIYPLTTLDQIIMPDGSRLDITKLGGSGSGNDAVIQLNYSIVGGPNQPENPTENMIWIQTETTEIGKVYFSGIVPVNAIDKDIWISTSNYSSTVAFDSIRIGNDTMQTIYPISAKQYVSGVWIEKIAKSWQGGAWVDWWNGNIYDINHHYIDITGGWSGSGWSSYYNSYETQNAIDGSAGIVIKTSGSGNSAVCCGTVNEVNFSGYTKIAVTTTSFSNDFWFGISSQKTFWDTDAPSDMLAIAQITAKGTTNLMIPSDVSSGYVVVYGFSEGGAKTCGTVSKIQMLK